MPAMINAVATFGVRPPCTARTTLENTAVRGALGYMQVLIGAQSARAVPIALCRSAVALYLRPRQASANSFPEGVAAPGMRSDCTCRSARKYSMQSLTALQFFDRARRLDPEQTAGHAFLTRTVTAGIFAGLASSAGERRQHERDHAANPMRTTCLGALSARAV